MSRQFKDPRQVRYAMVRFAKEQGIKPAARTFSTTKKTVRKWLRRWIPGSMQGLDPLSRAPKRPFKRVDPFQRKLAIQLKLELPSWGAARIKRNYSLKISEKAIRKIWKEEGLMRLKRRKYKTKNDLRAVKASWGLFAQTCMDTKELTDIPEIWPAIQTGIVPKVQYTAREVVSGLQFLGFANEKSLNYSTLFVEVILHHLQDCGVALSGLTIQTDNGSEFVGGWNACELSSFSRMVESAKMIHKTIPPGAHTYQSDVETVHRIIEDEFYEVETFQSFLNFLNKASVYNVWFNVARKNSYKQYRTPWQIIHQLNPNINPRIAILPALDLEQLWLKKIQSNNQWGYHLIPHPFLKERVRRSSPDYG